jgi:hypothetical protein
MQRQIDGLERQIRDLTKENELVSNRQQTAQQEIHYRTTQGRSAEEEDRIRTTLTQLARQGILPLPSQTQPMSPLPQPRFAASANQHTPAPSAGLVLPSSLDRGTSNDIQSMMSALGRTSSAALPMDTPTSTSVSSNRLNNAAPSRLYQTTIAQENLDVSTTSLSSADSTLLGPLSVEKRLQAMVSAAMQSPTRQRKL